MAYTLTYRDSPDDVFSELETVERQHVRQKLTAIATNEYRRPRQWDFKRISTRRAEGQFRIGNGLRAFVDIDDANQRITVYDVDHRENLY
jgi:mRNA-degrading endonuclease RelE of RelBE toxin-antitoxin system